MSEDLERRVRALEEMLAHRESEFQDLSDMVSQQWTRIDALQRELERAKDRLISLEDEVGDAPAANQKPPHW
ncbi:MAG: SlyX family protein [Alphaproteobacteria bacterium]|nr:SlyX family protein [Alphaproteobacteria bacterium]